MNQPDSLTTPYWEGAREGQYEAGEDAVEFGVLLGECFEDGTFVVTKPRPA